MGKYVLQCRILDGKFDDTPDVVISDGSDCRFRNDINEEEGFSGGTWPSGGVDTHQKHESMLTGFGWMNETRPLSANDIARVMSDRDIVMEEGTKHLPPFGKTYSNGRCEYRVIKHED